MLTLQTLAEPYAIYQNNVQHYYSIVDLKKVYKKVHIMVCVYLLGITYNNHFLFYTRNNGLPIYEAILSNTALILIQLSTINTLCI